MKLNLIFCLLLFGTLACGKKDIGPQLQTDYSLNSLNFGLIGINQNNLFLNKVNDVTAYDFNGNQIKILNTYNRSKYNSIMVKDSFLAISNQDLVLYKMSNTGTLTEVTKTNYLYNSYTTSDLILKDTLMILLNNRFLSNVRTYYSNAESRVLSAYVFNSSKNTITAYTKGAFSNLNASSFALYQDSILFFMNNKINKCNLNDANPIISSFDGFNPVNDMTTSICIGDRLYTSNSKYIFGFAYANNKLTAKGEIK